MVNNGANASKITISNLKSCESCCMICLNRSINVASERETPTNAYAIRSAAKITVNAFSTLISHSMS